MSLRLPHELTRDNTDTRAVENIRQQQIDESIDGLVCELSQKILLRFGIKRNATADIALEIKTQDRWYNEGQSIAKWSVTVKMP